MHSKSEMKRIAVQKPELLIKEIERLRVENEKIASEARYQDMRCKAYNEQFLKDKADKASLREALKRTITEIDLDRIRDIATEALEGK